MNINEKFVWLYRESMINISGIKPTIPEEKKFSDEIIDLYLVNKTNDAGIEKLLDEIKTRMFNNIGIPCLNMYKEIYREVMGSIVKEKYNIT